MILFALDPGLYGFYEDLWSVQKSEGSHYPIKNSFLFLCAMLENIRACFKILCNSGFTQLNNWLCFCFCVPMATPFFSSNSSIFITEIIMRFCYIAVPGLFVYTLNFIEFCLLPSIRVHSLQHSCSRVPLILSRNPKSSFSFLAAKKKGKKR